MHQSSLFFKMGRKSEFFFLTFFCGIFSFSLDTAICYTHLVEENVVMINVTTMKEAGTKALVARFGGGILMTAPQGSVFTTASLFLLLIFLLSRHLKKKHSSRFEWISISLPRILPVQRTAVIPSRGCARNQFAAAPIEPSSA